MTIFRHHNPSTSLTTTSSSNDDSVRPVLEAVTSSSRYLLADFDNKDNVVVSSDLLKAETETVAVVEKDDHTNTSHSHTSSQENNNHNNNTEEEEEEDDTAQELSQAFLQDFSVQLDPSNDNAVTVKMDVPDGIPSEDLTVQVDDDCILRVAGKVPVNLPLTDMHGDSESSSTTTSPSTTTANPTMRVEQAFQLDEQSLDIDNLHATLGPNGTLTITTPQKEEEDSTLLESLPILSHRPPSTTPDTFVVLIDVPGVHLEDLHVSYANSKLRVSAARHFGRVRSFKRTLDVDTQQFQVDDMKVYLNQGRLTVHVPPKETKTTTTTATTTNDDCGVEGVREIEIVEQD